MSTLRTRLTGLAALAGLLLVLLGTPAVLVSIGASPFPDGIPTLEQAWATLTGVDDGTAILTLLRLAAWGAWAYLAIGVLLEVTSRARGVRPPHIRGLGLSQTAAHALVSAALLAFTTLPTLATPAAAAAPVVVAATPLHAARTSAAAPVVAAGADVTPAIAQDTAPALVHTVRPGETLWGIAQTHLGDGARFVQIAHANYGQPQPDGRALTTSHRIHPGWQLIIPTTPEMDTPATLHAPGVEKYTVQPGDTLWDIAGQHLGEPTRYGEIYTASRHLTQPGGHRLSDPDQISPGWTLHIPTGQDEPAAPADPQPDGAGAPVPAPEPGDDAGDDAGPVEEPDTSGREEPAVEGPAVESPAVEGDHPGAASARQGSGEVADSAGDAHSDGGADLDGDADDAARAVRTSAGVGSLLAAGVIGLLATHRAVQSRRRRPGLSLPMPEGTSAATETGLRTVADPFGVTAVDTALRTLARDCAQNGRPLPVLRYARLTGAQLDLHLAEPARLPSPWTGTTDATVWTLRVEDADLLDPAEAEQITAPYPSLVTIGHDDDDAHVFLDLEQVASLALLGEEATTRQVLAALAVELATCAWTDHLTITIVAAFPELEDALRTGRIRYLPSAGHLFEELTARAETDRATLAGAGAADLQHARTSDAAPDTWFPEIVLMATPLTARQHTQLTALLENLPRVAVAAVTTGPGPGPWTLTLTDTPDPASTDPGAVLAPLGLHLRPQRIDPAGYRDILDLLALTGTTPTDAYPTGHQGGDVPPTHAHAADPTHAHAADQGADTQPGNAGVSGQGAPTAPGYGGQGFGQGGDPAAARGRHGLGADPQSTPTVGDTMPDLRGQTSGQTGEAAPAHDAGDVAESDGPHPADDGGEGFDDPPEPATPSTGTPAASDAADALPAPFIRLLGPVVVENPRGRAMDVSHMARASEIAAYLSLRPGASATAMQEALWPDSRSSSTRNTMTSKLRTWLGEIAPKQPYLLPYDARTGYVLHPAVRSDWDLWRDLLPDGPLPAPTDRLEQALDLVRGRPLENATPSTYAWAEPDRAQMIAQIADAACELARRRAQIGDWRGAEEAALRGLAIDPALERLWRVRILAAHAGVSPHAGQEAIERMLTIAGQLGGDLETETTALLTGLRTGINPRTLLDAAP